MDFRSQGGELRGRFVVAGEQDDAAYQRVFKAYTFFVCQRLANQVEHYRAECHDLSLQHYKSRRQFLFVTDGQVLPGDTAFGEPLGKQRRKVQFWLACHIMADGDIA